MARKFKTVDYEAMLKQTIRLEECLPPTHLAYFVVQTLAQLDLSGIYQEYGAKGGMAIVPEILLGLLFYDYATGVFSSRELEGGQRLNRFRFDLLRGTLHGNNSCRIFPLASSVTI